MCRWVRIMASIFAGSRRGLLEKHLTRVPGPGSTTMFVPSHSIHKPPEARSCFATTNRAPAVPKNFIFFIYPLSSRKFFKNHSFKLALYYTVPKIKKQGVKRRCISFIGLDYFKLVRKNKRKRRLKDGSIGLD